MTGIKAKAEKLQQLQATLGKTNAEMAELIGVSRKTLENALEGGTVSSTFMAKVSVTFGISFDTYFETVEVAA